MRPSIDYTHQYLPDLTLSSPVDASFSLSRAAVGGCVSRPMTGSKRPRRFFEAEGRTERVLGPQRDAATEDRTRLCDHGWRSGIGGYGEKRQVQLGRVVKAKWWVSLSAAASSVSSSQRFFGSVAVADWAKRGWRGGCPLWCDIRAMVRP